MVHSTIFELQYCLRKLFANAASLECNMLDMIGDIYT